MSAPNPCSPQVGDRFLRGALEVRVTGLGEANVLYRDCFRYGEGAERTESKETVARDWRPPPAPPPPRSEEVLIRRGPTGFYSNFVRPIGQQDFWNPDDEVWRCKLTPIERLQ